MWGSPAARKTWRARLRPRRTVALRAIAVLGAVSLHACGDTSLPTRDAGRAPPELVAEVAEAASTTNLPAATPPLVEQSPSSAPPIPPFSGAVAEPVGWAAPWPLDDCPLEVTVPEDFVVELHHSASGSPTSTRLHIDASGSWWARARGGNFGAAAQWNSPVLSGTLNRTIRWGGRLERSALARVLCALDRSGAWHRVPEPSRCLALTDVATDRRPSRSGTIIELRAHGYRRRIEVLEGRCPADDNPETRALIRELERATSGDIIEEELALAAARAWNVAPTCLDALPPTSEIHLAIVLDDSLALTKAESLRGDLSSDAYACVMERLRSGEWLREPRERLGMRASGVQFIEMVIRARFRYGRARPYRLHPY